MNEREKERKVGDNELLYNKKEKEIITLKIQLII